MLQQFVSRMCMLSHTYVPSPPIKDVLSRPPPPLFANTTIVSCNRHDMQWVPGLVPGTLRLDVTALEYQTGRRRSFPNLPGRFDIELLLCTFAVGQGSIIGALLCTSNFLHPGHYTVPCIMQNTWFFFFCNFSHGCPFQWPLSSMCGSSKPITPKKKKWHTERLSVELNMHPNRRFPGPFVVHILLCLHVFVCVLRPLCSLPRGEGGRGNHHLGYVPLGL